MNRSYVFAVAAALSACATVPQGAMEHPDDYLRRLADLAGRGTECAVHTSKVAAMLDRSYHSERVYLCPRIGPVECHVMLKVTKGGYEWAVDNDALTVDAVEPWGSFEQHALLHYEYDVHGALLMQLERLPVGSKMGVTP